MAPIFGRTEPDPEIQEILRGSHGLNVGLHYLDGAFNFDGLAVTALGLWLFVPWGYWVDRHRVLRAPAGPPLPRSEPL